MVGLHSLSRLTLDEMLDSADPFLASNLLNQLWADAESSTSKQNIGLLAAQSIHASQWLGLLFHRALAAETLGHAVRDILVGRPVLSPSENLRWEILKDGSYRLTVGYVGGIERCSPSRAEFALAMFLNAISFFAGHRIRPRLVRLNRQLTENMDPYRSVFGDQIVMGAPETSMDFSAQALDFPLPTATPVVRRLLDPILGTLFRGLADSNVVTSVRAAIHEQLPYGNLHRKSIAKRLCMSERTLQRRLAEADTSYAEVLDQLRKKMAKAFIEQGMQEYTQLAFELGYSDSSCIYRALRRWGIMPGKLLNPVN